MLQVSSIRQENNSRPAVYRLYGRMVASGFAFANQLIPGASPPDLSFECISSSPLPGALDSAEPAYASPPAPKDGRSDILLYRLDACLAVRFRTADFYLWDDRIVCHLPDPEYSYLVEIQLLGVVFSCWLEWQGIPALHASAVATEWGAAAFLATAGGGKSSLAMALMDLGRPLLTDDILPVERRKCVHVGHPGYPQVRMWPDQARRFLGSYEDLDIVHPSYSKRRVRIGEDGFGTFSETSIPLRCLYLPDRRDPADWGERIEITRLSRREGLMALVGQSFAAHIVEALGMQLRRLGLLAALVGEVPVCRITYPNGFEHLPRVAYAILDDLARLPSSGRRGA